MTAPTPATEYRNVSVGAAAKPCAAASQGLTLAHFKAQLERFLWDRGCA